MLAHRIARERGEVNVRAMMEFVSPRELAELAAFQRMEPGGPLEQARWAMMLLREVWDRKEPPELKELFPQLAADRE